MCLTTMLFCSPTASDEPLASKTRRSRDSGYWLARATVAATFRKVNVAKASDFLLITETDKDAKIVDIVEKTRSVAGYRTMPVVSMQDDHFISDKPFNNFVAATSVYTSWGFFDYRMKDEGYDDGYQSMPANWGISSPRKKGFFEKLKEIVGLD